MIDLAKLDRPPAGFAACVECAYRQHGSPPICFACAAENTQPISENACAICDQGLKPDGTCGNPVCNWDDRYFDMVWAISMRTGQMKSAISRYKYDGRYGWAGIFGRILVGFLNEWAPDFDGFDAIIPSPTFVGEGGRGFDHIERIVQAAQIEEPLKWPFEFGIVEKTAPTERFVGKSWRERKEIAEGPLRAALRVPHESRVEGRSFLVVDDVFTEGFTIREVARGLRLAGDYKGWRSRSRSRAVEGRLERLGGADGHVLRPRDDLGLLALDQVGQNCITRNGADQDARRAAGEATGEPVGDGAVESPGVTALVAVGADAPEDGHGIRQIVVLGHQRVR